MDIQTISIVLVCGLLVLLAIGMPLGMASAALALLVLVMKFEPTLLSDPMSFGEGTLTRRPGTGPLYVLAQKIFDLLSEYVLISVPLFIFMAALLERSGVAKAMYDSLDFWLSRVRGGIAIITSLMAVLLAAMSGIIGGEIVLLGLIALPQMLRLGYDQNLAIGTSGYDDSTLHRINHLWAHHRNVYQRLSRRCSPALLCPASCWPLSSSFTSSSERE